MIGGRVFNGIDHVPAEIRIIGWRIGTPMMILAVILLFISLGLLQFSLLVGFISLGVFFIIYSIFVVILNMADQHKVVSELTVLSLLVSALWSRHVSNVDFDER